MRAVHSLTKVASSAGRSSRTVPSAAGARMSDIRRYKTIIPGRGMNSSHSLRVRTLLAALGSIIF
jgi:hypothetical protein